MDKGYNKPLGHEPDKSPKLKEDAPREVPPPKNTEVQLRRPPQNKPNNRGIGQ